MNTELSAAFEAFKPMIAESYARMVSRAFDRMVEQFGPALRGVYNSESAKFYGETVARFTTRQGNRLSDPVVMDADKLAKGAAAYADAVVMEWAAKVEGKVGELDAAEVKRMDGIAFLIRGTRGGKKVEIEQQMILKSSPRGTLFNQFPARIYVDGKFTPEAKYKAAFAA
jgi:hypothetical protein